MPLSSGSVHGKMSAHLKESALLVARRGVDPDLNVPLSAVSKMKLTSRSLRRMSDSVARAYMEKHNSQESARSTLDALMGWKEAERRTDMQIHYEEQHIRRRIAHYMLTSEM